MQNASRDAFLGGRLTITQPQQGYRAGADPVFLAASIPANPGDRILDLGCGVGTASLCLGARVPDVSLFGVERDAPTADMARQNATDNDISLEVTTADITDLPPTLKSERFDHVMANPPFFDRTSGSTASGAAREAARGETLSLSTWVDTALRRTAPGGTITIIQRAERLADLLAGFDSRAGSLVVQPLAPRIGQPAKLILLQARKGGRGALRLNAPIVLHSGTKHITDGDSYTPLATDVLRHGAALPIK